MAAASKSVVGESNSTDTWPKWQVALAIGAPLAVVIGGIWVYKRSKRKSSKSSPKKQDVSDGSASQNLTGNATDSLNTTVSPSKSSPEKNDPEVEGRLFKNNVYFIKTRWVPFRSMICPCRIRPSPFTACCKV